MSALLISLLATAFLPNGCTLPGWSFCVRMPLGAELEVAQDAADPVIYRFSMADGSRTFVGVGESTEMPVGGSWSERRQGLETLRWRADGQGRIDYYIERVWAESAGIPRWLHVWIEASETGEISDAEALVATLQSCDPRLCPAPGPVDPARLVSPDLPPDEPAQPSDPARAEGPVVLTDGN